jgi:hypothetical protein
MYSLIKQLTKRRSEMEERANIDDSLFDDLDFQREIENVCTELMKLNSNFQKQTDRAIIEWDSFIGDTADIALGLIINDISRN